jgi:hypothetical protein
VNIFIWIETVEDGKVIFEYFVFTKNGVLSNDETLGFSAKDY